LAGAKKNCAREGQTIVFIDESGVSERPHRVRTWAPKGKTPVRQYSFTWNQLSAVAGVPFWNIYFKLVKGAIRAPEIVTFLKNLRRHLAPRKLLIIWDRLQAHRSRLVRDYVASEGGGISSNSCRPPRQNSIPSRIWGRIGSSMKWQTSVRRALPNSALLPAPSSTAHRAAKLSSQLSGNKPSCPSDVTLFVKDQ
jgi:hypothetical protein